MKNLKAFTLMELLVGMIVSSIVIGFGYSGYALIYRQFLSFKGIKTATVQAAQFHCVFGHDFEATESAFYEEGKIRLLKKEEVIVYEFGDSAVYRVSNEVIDTFMMRTFDLSVQQNFTTETQRERSNTEKRKLIDGIRFKGIVLKEEEPFQFRKTYSAKTLMEEEARYEN